MDKHTHTRAHTFLFTTLAQSRLASGVAARCPRRKVEGDFFSCVVMGLTEYVEYTTGLPDKM